LNRRHVLVLGLCLAGCAADSGGGAPARIRRPDAATNRVWEWERTVAPSGTLESPAPQRYTLELSPNGRLLVRADCNRGTGAYRIGDGTIALGPIATTRMACPPGSLGEPYLRDLQRAADFFVENAHLFLELPADAGTMRFRPAQ
jgi:heat shock protein HslJ